MIFSRLLLWLRSKFNRAQHGDYCIENTDRSINAIVVDRNDIDTITDGCDVYASDITDGNVNAGDITEGDVNARDNITDGDVSACDNITDGDVNAGDITDGCDIDANAWRSHVKFYAMMDQETLKIPRKKH